jgi:hypothetical protein
MGFKDDLTSPGQTRTKRIIGMAALVGFIVSAAVHLSTFLGSRFAATMDSGVLALHFAIFPLFFAMLFSQRAETKGMDKRDVLLNLGASVPRWAKAVIIFFFLYTPVNFFRSMSATGGASAEQSATGQVLTSHGRVIRHVTQEEALENKAMQTRLFSGHWMMFYLLPALFFLARREPVLNNAR